MSPEPQHSEASPQHTPGPWEWKMPPWGGREWLVPASKDLETLPYDADYRPILDSDPSGDEYFPAIDSESPDARLIAAAPDLLAALKVAVECLDVFDVANEIMQEMRWMRATVAKAEGRQP